MKRGTAGLLVVTLLANQGCTLTIHRGNAASEPIATTEPRRLPPPDVVSTIPVQTVADSSPRTIRQRLRRGARKSVEVVKATAVLTGVVVLWIASCAHDNDDDEDQEDEHDRQLNALWRGGYGFNNPNPDRIRRGEEPLDFSDND